MDRQQQHILAADLGAGDSRAWEQFYNAYAERLFRAVCRLMGPDCPDTADVVQDTLLAAARSARGYRTGRGSLWAWLWGIARRQIALHYRKRGGPTTIVSIETSNAAINWIDAKADPPLEVLQSRELASLVRLALGRLSDEHQILLLGKYADGQTVGELADDLGCSTAAAGSKLARAKKAFRRHYRRITRSSHASADTTEVTS